MWSCSSPHFMGMFGGIWMWLCLTLFIAVVYFIVKAFTGKETPGNNIKDRYDSLEILKVRLAKGEISIDEFNALKNALL
ncbi:SHOCT domain-containing protein [Desulfovibrio desulfuricans]|uniref:SHOCT domain-containing protein n=1 Tax=Desulfovibrio desulfuricans TaxID=876 RepID=UPI0003B331D1|nr:SHOCT domain-containing protein [Desulfovibrio desulfuricans]